MRITDDQKDAIIQTYLQLCPKAKGLWLFGSRCDDSKLGEDIDLFIDINDDCLLNTFELRVKFIVNLIKK